MNAARRVDGNLGARRRARTLATVVSCTVLAVACDASGGATRVRLHGDGELGEAEVSRSPHSTIAALVAAETAEGATLRVSLAADGAAGRVEPPDPPETGLRAEATYRLLRDRPRSRRRRRFGSVDRTTGACPPTCTRRPWTRRPGRASPRA
jgi:hypothetical protein